MQLIFNSFFRLFKSSKQDQTWLDKENQQNENAIYAGTFRSSPH